MTSNIVKNFAAATVAGAFLSFAIASAAVTFAVVFNATSGHSVDQTDVTSTQR